MSRLPTPREETLEQASLGEFLDAKMRATERRVGEWLDTGNNAEKAFMTSFAGFSALAAGTEIAANLLRDKEGRKGLMERGALHAASLASLAGAGVSLLLEGIVIADKEARQ
jgi:hypothetical protein